MILNTFLGKHNSTWLNLKCDFCGKEYTENESKFYSHGKVNNYNFCSKVCFTKNIYKNKELLTLSRTINCGICGKTFVKDNGKTKYCSLECSYKRKRDLDSKKKRIVRAKNRVAKSVCVLCGKEINYNKNEMCGSCRKEYDKPIITLTNCEVCGIEFMPKNKFKVKYCSQHCSRQANSSRNRVTKHLNRQIRFGEFSTHIGKRTKKDRLFEWSWDRKECMVCDETRAVEWAHLFIKVNGDKRVAPMCRNHHWMWDHMNQTEAYRNDEILRFFKNILTVYTKPHILPGNEITEKDADEFIRILETRCRDNVEGQTVASA